MDSTLPTFAEALYFGKKKKNGLGNFVRMTFSQEGGEEINGASWPRLRLANELMAAACHHNNERCWNAKNINHLCLCLCR